MIIKKFLEDMKEKHSVRMYVKCINEELSIPDYLPESLKEIYKICDSVEFPFGEIYPLTVTLKQDEPFKSEGWYCFGFDGYFSYWLCKKNPNGQGELFASYVHEIDDEIEAMHDNLIQFLMDLDKEYESEYCKVILMKQIEDKKLAIKIRKDFMASLSMNEFVNNCSIVPFVINEEMEYGKVVEIISNNREYEEYIQIEM